MIQGRSHPKQTLFIPSREEFYNKSCRRRVVKEGLYQKIYVRRTVQEVLHIIPCQAIFSSFRCLTHMKYVWQTTFWGSILYVYPVEKFCLTETH